MDQAFRTSREVILIFSVNKSGEFYGYARCVRLQFGQDTTLTLHATGWRVASLVAIVMCRGHRAQIRLPVHHRPHPAACPPMAHRSSVKAHRCILRPLSTGWLKRRPLHSRLLQTKRKIAHVWPAGLLRHDSQRHLRLVAIPKTPLVPIHLRRRVMGDGPESRKILTPRQLCDLSWESTLECGQGLEARVVPVVARLIRVISGCACQLLWRRGVARVVGKKTKQHQRA